MKAILKHNLTPLLNDIKYDINWIRSELSFSWLNCASRTIKEDVTFFLSCSPNRMGDIIPKHFAEDLKKILLRAEVSFHIETFYFNGKYDTSVLRIKGAGNVLKLKDIHSVICEYLTDVKHKAVKA